MGFTNLPLVQDSTLRGKYVRSTRFAIINAGTSGTVTIPANSEVILDDFGGTVDAVVSQSSGGKPSVTPAQTAGGDIIATTFDTDGNWVLTDTPDAYPIAIVYRVRQTLFNFDSTASDIWGIPTVESSFGGTGDVVGPASSTNNNIASFDGTDGKLLKDSGVSASSGAVVATSYRGTLVGINKTPTHSLDIQLPADNHFMIDASTNQRTMTSGVVRIEHTPASGSAGTRAIHLDINAGANGDTHAMFIDYSPSGFTGSKEAHVIDLVADSTGSTGGEVVGLSVSKIGTGSVSMVGMETYMGVIPIESKTGSEINPTYVQTSATGSAPFVDITASAISSSSDVQLWTTNNSYLYIGSSAKFNIINMYFQTAISSDEAGIIPTFEYLGYDGEDPAWYTFTPSDGTNGARNNGSITYSHSNFTSWITLDNGSGTTAYWVRIRRTNASLVTPPTEDYMKIASTTTYKWDESGNVNIATLRGTGSGGFGISAINTNTRFELNRAFTTSAVQYGQLNTFSFSASDSSARYGIYQSVSAASGAVISGDIVGVHSSMTPSDTGNITNLTSFEAKLLNAIDDGSFGTYYGFRVRTPTGGGALVPQNFYGLYIDAQTSATNNYGIRSLIASGTGRYNLYIDGTAVNYFAGRVGVGTASPNVELEVNGYIRQGVTNGISIGSDAGRNRIVGYPSGPTIRVLDSANTYSTFAAKTLSIGATYGATAAPTSGAIIEGNVGIANSSPTAALDVNSNIIRLRTAKTPASATDTGNAGDICWDANYIYVCTATNTWVRAALATW